MHSVRVGAKVPAWEQLTALVFLIGPMIGVFWSPESYVAVQEFSIRSAEAVDMTRGFTYGGLGTYAELVWLLFAYARRPAVMVGALLRSSAPLAFGCIVLLSATWSPDLSVSFNRGARLILVILFCIYLIERFTTEQIILLITISLSVAIVASFLAVVFVPRYGLSSLNGYTDAWRGAFNHKNNLGATMSNAVIVALFGWRTRIIPSWLALSTLLGAIILLVEARSATAGIAALIAIASVFPLLALGSARRPEDKIMFVLFLLVCSICLMAAIDYIDDVLLLFGRNPNLTGRTAIWQSVWALIQQKPWTGYGHAFWTIESPLRATLWTSYQWATPHAHNTMLDIWFQTGVVGLIFAFYVVASAIARGIGSLFDGNAVVVTTFWLSNLIDLMVRMFSETLLVDPGTGGALWLCLAYMGLTKIRDQRRRRTRGFQTATRGSQSAAATGGA